MLCLAAAACLKSHAAPASDELWMGLDRAGAAKGLTFEQSIERQTLYFPLPSDTARRSATLELHLRWSPMLREPSNVRVIIGDISSRVIPLTFGSNEIARVDLPLTSSQLQGKFLRVTFAVAATASHDSCIDDRLRAGFFQILPETGVRLITDGEPPKSVRAFFDRLPLKVTLSLSSRPPTQEMLKAVLQTLVLLRDAGHEVRITRLPEHGDIAIGPEAEIAAATGSLAPSDREEVRVRQAVDGSTVLTIAEPYAVARTGILQLSWLGLAASNAYAGSAGIVNATTQTGRKPLTIYMESLTSGSNLRETGSSSEWSLRPDARLVPPDYQLSQLTIRVAQAPGMQNLPVLLYAYVNGNLLRTIRLSDDGEPHSFVVNVPESALRGSSSAQ
ncbi:MAG: cellulose biosynthesis cyclic di-GMP-binding regulatory protein BcsB, partial [Bryobacteraceae bacterium]|nr:cellulose biosynthesis cyclic di-GMP-binding regulatory protein BcsB [Bryobacteraceae bacterium]